ncbi:MAG: arylesterase [Candidatus Moranbacteria bacterium]|nr:arylesterase [Candidatus Moranbacteria bacterium]
MKTSSVGSIILGSIILFGGLGWYFFSDAPIKNYPSTSRGPVLMFGDSLVEGVGATAGQTLPEQLGRILNAPVLNYGVSGDTTRDALLRLNQAVAEKPRIAIVLLGGNDFLKKIPREVTFANLEKIVSAFQEQGAITVVLGVRSGIVGGGADAEYEDLAKRTGSVYMSDVLAGLFGRTELMSDALHPNDRGYAKIAERLAPLLSKYVP